MEGYMYVKFDIKSNKEEIDEAFKIFGDVPYVDRHNDERFDIGEFSKNRANVHDLTRYFFTKGSRYYHY